MLPVNIGLAIIEDLDNHLKGEVIYDLKDFLIDIKVRIIDFQDIFLSVFLYEEHLGLSGVVAQNSHIPIVDAFQNEILILDSSTLRCHAVCPHRSVERYRLGTSHRSNGVVMPHRKIRITPFCRVQSFFRHHV